MDEKEILYNDVIRQSQENVKALSEKLKAFDKLLHDIEIIKEDGHKIPSIFETKFQEIVTVSHEYTENLGKSAKIYLAGNNELFAINLNEFSNKISSLNIEIERLVKIDFVILFEDLQKVFIEKSRKDFEIEFQKFDEKAKLFQSKIELLQNEIDRLINTDFIKLFENFQTTFIEKTRQDFEIELKKFDDKSKQFQISINTLNLEIDRLKNIDFEIHFDKLQKTLSDIFGAINSINLSLTTVIQTLNNLVQSIGNIQIKIETNHNETKQLIKDQNEEIGRQIKEQNIEIKYIKDLLVSKTKLLEEQNEILTKDMKTNKIIMIVGFLLLIITLIFSIVK